MGLLKQIWQTLSIHCINFYKIKIYLFPNWEYTIPNLTNQQANFVRVIAKRTLVQFYENHSDAETPLIAWHDFVLKANWQTPQDIKNDFASASFAGNTRVVFNIGGNNYRLVADINYQIGAVWIKFIGTHAQYDKIDVESVNDY